MKADTSEAREARLLIDRAGGIAKFAELLGLTDDQFWKQRVHNWRSRGIPPKVRLDHLETLKRLSEDIGTA